MNNDNQIQAVNITRAREDYLAFSRHATKAFQNLRVYYIVALTVAFLLLLMVIDILMRKNVMPGDLYIWFFSVVVGVYVVAIILRKFFNRSSKQEFLNENQAFLRNKRITIDEKGLRETSDVSEGYVMWQGVDRIERTKTLMLVYVDKMSAFVIPIRNFSTPEQANEFYENMLAYWHKAHGRAVPVRPQ